MPGDPIARRLVSHLTLPCGCSVQAASSCAFPLEGPAAVAAMKAGIGVEVLLRSAVLGRAEWVNVAAHHGWTRHEDGLEFEAAGVHSVNFGAGVAPGPGLEVPPPPPP